MPLLVHGLDLVTCFIQIEYGKGNRLSFPKLTCKTVTLLFLALILWKPAVMFQADLWRVPHGKELRVSDSWHEMRVSVQQPVRVLKSPANSLVSEPEEIFAALDDTLTTTCEKP